MTKSFDVFLSHNSKDKSTVRELAEALRARGLKVWLDEWELVPGRPWQEALEEVIETTGASAVLVGKDGIGPWQDAEMRGCLSEFVERQLPVIPVLLPDAPAVPRLPFFLKRFTWVDFREGLTEEGISRLQWGITGKRVAAPTRDDLDETLSLAVVRPLAQPSQGALSSSWAARPSPRLGPLVAPGRTIVTVSVTVFFLLGMFGWLWTTNRDAKEDAFQKIQQQEQAVQGSIVIQVFSSPEESEAQKVVSLLQEVGRVYIAPIQVGERTSYRVRVGPFSNRESAERVATIIRHKWKLDTWVTE